MSARGLAWKTDIVPHTHTAFVENNNLLPLICGCLGAPLHGLEREAKWAPIICGVLIVRHTHLLPWSTFERGIFRPTRAQGPRMKRMLPASPQTWQRGCTSSQRRGHSDPLVAPRETTQSLKSTPSAFSGHGTYGTCKSLSCPNLECHTAWHQLTRMK